MRQEFDSEVLDLVKKKGFYPYEHMSGLENFNETLPNKNEFYTSLTGKNIIDKMYQKFHKVWNKSEIKTMKDYHVLHLKCHVLLLADVFIKFR